MKESGDHKINFRVQVLVLISIIINVLFNYLYEYIFPRAHSMKEVSDKYANLFTPAGYVFSIWGIIYISFIAYGISQFMRVQQGRSIHYILAWPMITVNVLAMAWIMAFSHEMIGLSVMIISGMLMAGIMMFRRVKRLKQQSLWLNFPFSIFLGWITVAAIANVSVWLVSNGWDGGMIGGRSTAAMLMLLFVFMLAVWVAIAYNDLIYPSVIVWAAIGIGISDLQENRSVAYIAFSAAILIAVIVLTNSVVNRSTVFPGRKLSPQQEK